MDANSFARVEENFEITLKRPEIDLTRMISGKLSIEFSYKIFGNFIWTTKWAQKLDELGYTNQKITEISIPQNPNSFTRIGSAIMREILR